MGQAGASGGASTEQAAERARSKRRADGPSDGQIKMDSHRTSYAKSIASVQALTWEVIGSRTWESAGVRNRENEMESNRVSDRDIEMKSVTEKLRYRHEATEVVLLDVI
ncbi:hypothetical protein F2Q68_00030213 [Brassica cretica]|uniref:Uncharacterized protein n=1 Tax=Brassica cretica TaxID=69181 RepID=A0A8S9GEG4_BRACR|nr:hypothetical protein F2Q68_00030213 [Brassica cretica]